MTKRVAGTALYAVSEYAEFWSLLALSRAVHSELGLHPVFLFKHDYGALSSHTKHLEALRFSWASAKSASLHTNYSELGHEDDYVPTYVKSPVSKQPESSRTAARLTWFATVAAIIMTPLILVAAIAALVGRRIKLSAILTKAKRLGRMHPGLMLRRYKYLKAEVGKVFDIFQPSIVISGQDYSLSVTAMASLAAEERGIRTAIVPFSMTPTTKELAESLSGSRTNVLRGKLLTRLIKDAFPHWINHYHGRDYTRLSLAEILTAEELHLAAPIPWLPNSGRGVLLLPGEQSADYCANAGIPRGQLRVTGAQWSDRLWSQKATVGERRMHLIDDVDSFTNAHRVKNLLPPIKFHDEAKVVLISWPPDQTPRSPTGFKDFNDLCSALAETLSRIHYGGIARVVVSLHPTLIGLTLHDDLKSHGIYVLDQDLVDVLDCSDIFSATVSSTLLWSLQLEIPSVNFDIYRYGYREFGEAGIVDVASVPDLRRALLTLIRAPQKYAEAKERLRRHRSYWGFFDGSCTKRIVSELSSLMQPEARDTVTSNEE